MRRLLVETVRLHEAPLALIIETAHGSSSGLVLARVFDYTLEGGIDLGLGESARCVGGTGSSRLSEARQVSSIVVVDWHLSQDERASRDSTPVAFIHSLIECQHHWYTSTIDPIEIESSSSSSSWNVQILGIDIPHGDWSLG